MRQPYRHGHERIEANSLPNGGGDKPWRMDATADELGVIVVTGPQLVGGTLELRRRNHPWQYCCGVGTLIVEHKVRAGGACPVRRDDERPDCGLAAAGIC